jgi:hypothetical protein
MPSPNLIQDVKKRSACSIFMGVVTAALGVPDCLSHGNCDPNDCPAGLGIDLRRHRPVRVRTSLANGRKVFLEGSPRRVVRNLRTLAGILPGWRRDGADRNAGYTTAGRSRTGDSRGVPGPSAGGVGMVSVRGRRQLRHGRADPDAMAFQLSLGNRHPGRSCVLSGWSLADYDRLEDTERRRQR